MRARRARGVGAPHAARAARRPAPGRTPHRSHRCRPALPPAAVGMCNSTKAWGTKCTIDAKRLWKIFYITPSDPTSATRMKASAAPPRRRRGPGRRWPCAALPLLPPRTAAFDCVVLLLHVPPPLLVLVLPLVALRRAARLGALRRGCAR